QLPSSRSLTPRMIAPPLQFEKDEYVSHRLLGRPPFAFFTSSLFPSRYGQINLIAYLSSI
ncbi:MAG: hypothetical protein K5662_09380, partial [Lachnospiraceae bacterium]|nr:hypothetical protein [Lachnospiraceae bacterium]